MKKTTFLKGNFLRTKLLSLFTLLLLWGGFVLTGLAQQITVTYNTPGTYTVGVPSCHVTTVKGEAWGGGGGGGTGAGSVIGTGYGSGGGGGAYVIKDYSANGGILTLTVGGGGAGGEYGFLGQDCVNGNTGTKSSVIYNGVTATANGGENGKCNVRLTAVAPLPSNNEGLGGSYANGDSGSGDGNNGNSSSAGGAGGKGGGTNGGNGGAALSTTANGNNGSSPGGGGSGGRYGGISGLAGGRSGGNGADGRGIITLNFERPVIAGLANPYCAGNTLTLTVSNPCAGVTYTWYKGATSTGMTGTEFTISNVAVSDAGTYTVKCDFTGFPFTGSTSVAFSGIGLAYSGGTITLTSDEVTVTVNSTPVIGDKTATICSGQTFIVTPADVLPDIVPAGTTYSWDLPVNSDVTGMTSGTDQSNISNTLTNTSISDQTVTYTVTPTSADGCTGADFEVKVTIYVPLDAGEIETDIDTVCTHTATLITIGNVTPATGGSGTITYEWFKNGTAISGSNSATYTIPATDMQNAGATDITRIYTRKAYRTPCDPVTSTGSYTLTVLPYVQGIISEMGESICAGNTPSQIPFGSVPSCCSEYKWSVSINSSAFTLITGATDKFYTPGANDDITAPALYQYMCEVYNPIASTWESVLNTWDLVVRVAFDPGMIQAAGETICAGGVPSTIASVLAASSSTTPEYQWFVSTDNGLTSTLITGAADAFYIPGTNVIDDNITASGIYTYTRQAKDPAGCNIWTNSANVWVLTINPSASDFTIDCPADIVYSLPYGACEYHVTDMGTPVITLESGVDPALINSIQITNDAPANQTFGVGAHKITWTAASGACGSKSCEQWIVVNYPPCGTSNTVWEAGGTYTTDATEYKTPSIDGYEYPTVRVGCDCWMAENLKTTVNCNGDPIEGIYKYYDARMYPDRDANAAIFGLLYTFDAAATSVSGCNGACPSGWKLPSESQFLALNRHSVNDLRSINYWLTPGTNATEFNALPGGMYNSASNSFFYLMGDAYFWTNVTTSLQQAKACHLGYGCSATQIVEINSGSGLSVRCVKE